MPRIQIPSYQSAQILTELVNHTLETKKCTISNFNVEGTRLSIEQWAPWGELRVIWVIPFAPLISVVWNQLNGKVLQGELCYD